MQTEAQKRAKAKYRKHNENRVTVVFYPKDKEVLEFVKAHGGSAYLRELAYKAMDKKKGQA